jgi:hypothetical protein
MDYYAYTGIPSGCIQLVLNVNNHNGKLDTNPVCAINVSIVVQTGQYKRVKSNCSH